MRGASRFLLCALLLAAWLGQVHAQDLPAGYPSRPVRLITASVPGGGLDILTRGLAQMLSERLGQSVIVDNRPGASTLIATDLAAKAQPDGYTFLSGTETLRILGVTKRVPFDVRKTFEPVAAMASQPYILLVHPSLPVKTVKELIAYSLSQPVRYGSSGVGTVAHLGLETMTELMGAKLVHVPYKGGAQSLLALLSGEIQMYPGLLLSAKSAVQTGKARLFAACSLERIPAAPELPTVAEQGYPGFKITNSYALYAPAGVPAPIVVALNRLVSEFMNSPKMAQKLIAEGSQPGERMSPAQLKTAFARDYDDVERQIAQLKVKIY